MRSIIVAFNQCRIECQLYEGAMHTKVFIETKC